RVLAALRFVQDEVRYLGIEMGVRSHKPNAPDAVIKQRFGDCKDKSRLLVSLLQGMGIEASSVLVSTDNGRRVKDMLPTPTVFNHAIVLVRLNGQNYWLDPTRNYQNGNLDAVYQPNYRYALVISDQTSDLAKISDDINVVHGAVVEETFDLRDAIDKPATYKILTHYERYYADSMREDLSEANLKKTQQTYLNYMTRYFPRIKAAEKIKIDDDSTLNKLTVTEQYTVTDIWTKSNDERYILANFEPYLIDDKVKGVEAPIRTMPYAVTHPVRFQHTTRIMMPEGSSFDNELAEIEDKAFRFSRKVNFSNDVLLIDYVYESLNDHVMPEDIKAYSDKIREVRNLSFFQISMANPAMNFGEYQFASDDINWSIVSV
ncbi:MAG: transglutaminase family protein, partial [Gammaproteobacteria bacterium]|nr:transglutaminase family protein [Gammaproteobacteria bacterium]